jgi:DNA invertase Pin-like site-specific DNA recombinase
MKALLPGDVLTVTKLDRIARSSRDLPNIVHDLKERGCGFVSIGDSWCDTTNEMGRFMLTVMSGIAELEREIIRKRCQAGIERAKRKGTVFGRPMVLDAGQRKKSLSGMLKARPSLSLPVITIAVWHDLESAALRRRK